MATFINDNLEFLEREYGRKAKYIRQVIDTDPNVRSVQNLEQIYIVKVIRMPNTVERTQAGLAGGGNFDIGTRWFIIRKLPITPRIEDKIRLDSKQYTVLSYETLDDDMGHLLKCSSQEEGVTRE